MSDAEELEDDTLPGHLRYLVATADDVAAFVHRAHEEGEIHPEALPKAEKLKASLRDVIHALTVHEHLAITKDDVWKALTRKHREGPEGTIT